jgi:hypothetical protein
MVLLFLKVGFKKNVKKSFKFIIISEICLFIGLLYLFAFAVFFSTTTMQIHGYLLCCFFIASVLFMFKDPFV